MSYDAVIPRVRFHCSASLKTKVRFLNELRQVISTNHFDLSRNEKGAVVISDYDLLFTATPEEIEYALVRCL